MKHKFNLDRASGISSRGIPKDILAMIKRAKREFYRDGAVHTWITYYILGVKNHRQSVMDDSRALNTLSMIGNDSYLMRIKYITVNKAKEDNAGNNYVIRDYLNPIRKDNKTVIIDKYTSPGTLTGIDSHYYERDYPVTVTIYGLYKINPNIKKLAPMRTAVNLNCVEKRVIEHFTNATHGGKLTEKRRSAITSWGEQVRETGATIDDVKKLETLLRTPICVKTLTGEPLNTSRYNNKRTPIVIYDHNGHAWNESVMMFPKERKLRFYNKEESGRNIFDAILQLQKSCRDPVSVWLLSSEQQPGMEFDQFVTTSGELYRTEQLNSRMIGVARNFIKKPR